jgi:hypothetical protein
MSYWVRRALLAALCLFLPIAAMAMPAAKDEAVAFGRLAALGPGVNLSGWYGGWGDYSAQHTSTYTTPADLEFIHSIGLKYVRLCVDPAPLTTGGQDSPASVEALKRLDQSIDDILAAGLNLSLTVFPSSAYKKALLTPEGERAYLDLWKFLATHNSGRDPARVFFDLMNEPEIKDAEKWDAIQAKVVAAIRTVDKQHTLIATGANYDSISDMVKVTPLKDVNVVYTFHFYEPFPFTHQGATWGGPGLATLKDVPYPGDPEKIGPMVAAAGDPSARDMLAQYGSEGWDADVMRRRLKQARSWADQHHVPVICNEFGAFRDTIPAAQRAVFLHDVQTNLKALQIPWAMWDYRGNFGLAVHGAAGDIEPDVLILQALGLTLPATPVLTPAPPAPKTVPTP